MYHFTSLKFSFISLKYLSKLIKSRNSDKNEPLLGLSDIICPLSLKTLYVVMRF